VTFHHFCVFFSRCCVVQSEKKLQAAELGDASREELVSLVEYARTRLSSNATGNATCVVCCACSVLVLVVLFGVISCRARRLRQQLHRLWKDYDVLQEQLCGDDDGDDDGGDGENDNPQGADVPRGRGALCVRVCVCVFAVTVCVAVCHGARAGRPKAPPLTDDELFELDQRVFVLTALCVSREIDRAYARLYDDIARSYKCVLACGVVCRTVVVWRCCTWRGGGVVGLLWVLTRLCAGFRSGSGGRTA